MSPMISGQAHNDSTEQKRAVHRAGARTQNRIVVCSFTVSVARHRCCVPTLITCTAISSPHGRDVHLRKSRFLLWDLITRGGISNQYASLVYIAKMTIVKALLYAHPLNKSHLSLRKCLQIDRRFPSRTSPSPKGSPPLIKHP
jgi:hypothetical protein